MITEKLSRNTLLQHLVVFVTLRTTRSIVRHASVALKNSVGRASWFSTHASRQLNSVVAFVALGLVFADTNTETESHTDRALGFVLSDALALVKLVRIFALR